ncbi:hypothetical protein AD941_01225 [Gluconobacter albidus]|uniref:Transposase n=1 Tax=Gluconobacter albidus TaxID=318683 RepID=A0AAW3R270_9PROT|nr:hypothetical protein AD941_01225 [Gluconobacter albidus]
MIYRFLLFQDLILKERERILSIFWLLEICVSIIKLQPLLLAHFRTMSILLLVLDWTRMLLSVFVSTRKCVALV